MKAILALAALLVASSALAADIPVKAPRFDYPLDSAGWYIGVEAGASVAKAKVQGGLFANNLVSGNLNAAGGYVGGCIGYIRGNIVSWWAVQGCGDWQNITASAPGVAASVGSRWDSTIEARVGGKHNPVSYLLDALQNLGLNGLSFPTFTPVAPSNISVANAPRTYFAGGVDFKGIDGQFFQVGGTTVAISPMIKTGAIWQVLNSSGQPTGGVVDTFAKVAFMSKGVQVSNVFGTGGGLTAARGELGTTYTAGVAYYFGLPSR